MLTELMMPKMGLVSSLWPHTLDQVILSLILIVCLISCLVYFICFKQEATCSKIDNLI